MDVPWWKPGCENSSTPAESCPKQDFAIALISEPRAASWSPNGDQFGALRRAMSGDPAARPAKKTYLALVTPGLPPVGRFELFFSGQEARVRTSEAGQAEQQGVCRWELIRPANRRPNATQFDAIEVGLIGPGRRHQIRAGLSHFGHPLVDDQTYGGPRGPRARDGRHCTPTASHSMAPRWSHHPRRMAPRIASTRRSFMIPGV